MLQSETESTALYAPAFVDVFPLDSTRVQVEWQAVEGALLYRVFRDGAAIGEVVDLVFIDDSVAANGSSYSYWVQAVNGSGEIGAASQLQTVIPQAPPRIQSVQRTSAYHLAVVFDQAMRLDEILAHRFDVRPEVGLPTSAVADRGGLRVVLGFDTALPDSGAYELATRGLRGVSGAPLGDERYSFALVREKTRARLLGAEALDAHRVVLNFDKAVRAPEGANNFSLGAGVIVERVEIRDRQVTLFLREGAGIRPLGRSYRAVVEGLVDADGLAVRGEASFVFASADLSQSTPFPNPYVVRDGALLFGYLPLEATVSIYDVSGQLVRRLAELDGDGGVQWNGKNEAGVSVASGMYYYRIDAGSQSKVGSLAIVR